MQPLFSTDGLHARNTFKLWQDTLVERFVPLEQTRLDDAPFAGRIDAARVGSLQMIRMAHGAMRSEATPDILRRLDKGDTLVVVFKLAGTSTTSQDGRSSTQRAGDLVVVDHRPSVVTTAGADGQGMFLELPRERLESVLGPAKLYTALTLKAERASATLARSFFHELIRVRDQLTPDTADRMAKVGVDLLTACVAERMAQEVPRTVHGNVTVQRAKAYVEANLGDPDLDPPHLAAAVGVSLRRLQELFHERGRHISDYIWVRRLETAAKRLSDPACAHLSIGMLAYGCGFASQAHFARRFKDRYGMSPREHREAHRQDVQSVASASGRPSRSAY